MASTAAGDVLVCAGPGTRVVVVRPGRPPVPLPVRSTGGPTAVAADPALRNVVVLSPTAAEVLAVPATSG
jgi:hypothetical protein